MTGLSWPHTIATGSLLLAHANYSTTYTNCAHGWQKRGVTQFAGGLL